MTATFIIARLTFHEAARRRILLAALVLGLLFLAIYGIGLHLIQSDIERRDIIGRPVLHLSETYSFFLMAGLYVINFLTVMMTVLTSVDTLSGEIAAGTMHTIAAKPLRRWEIVLGKWLGFAGMLTLYLLLMAGGVMMIVYLRTGYVPPSALGGLGLMWFNVLMLLTVSLLGGTTLSTLANGVLIFGLYGVAFVGGWMGLVGAALGNQTVLNLGMLTSLLMPSEALWRRAAYEMRSPIIGGLVGNPFVGFPRGGASTFVPSPLIVGYAVAYTLIALALAIRQFNRRDL